MSLLDTLRDALARVVAARDCMEDGASREAEMILHSLEIDLAGTVARAEEEPWAA